MIFNIPSSIEEKHKLLSKISPPYAHFSLSGYLDRCITHLLAEQLAPNSIVVEVGTYLGSTMAIMAHANKDLILHAFDIFDDHTYDPAQNKFFAQALGKGKKRTLENVHKFLSQFYSNITLHQVDVNKEIEFDQEVDVIIEDGDHTEPALSKSLDFWLPKVKVNGFVLLHDYRPWLELNDPSRFPDVDQHVKNLKNDSKWKYLGMQTGYHFSEPSSYAIFQRISN